MTCFNTDVLHSFGILIPLLGGLLILLLLLLLKEYALDHQALAKRSSSKAWPLLQQ